MREKREKERERKRSDVYRRTGAYVYVECIEPHIGHMRENKNKKKGKVSGNNVTSVDANTFTVWGKRSFESPACS